jgi:two-component sensor histidine kinase
MTVTRSEGGDFVISHEVVTQLVTAERARAVAEEKLRLSLEAGQVGTFEVDLDEEEMVLDSLEARLLGLPDDRRRLSLADFNSMIMAPDDTPLEARIAKAGGRLTEELHLKLPDSTEHWLSFAAAPKNGGGQKSAHYVGLSFDVTERKMQEDRNRLVTREVRHRAKNLLAVVLAIARQTAGKKDPACFADEFSNRIVALSATLDLLGKREWRGVHIHELFEAHFQTFAQARDQVTFAGPVVMVRPEAAQMLGLALHELATNSLKYGALSALKGRISVEWSASCGRPGEEFALTWSEMEGPEVTAPTHRGFGYSVLMEQAAWAVGGRVEAHYPTSGLIWKLWAPLHEIAAEFALH